MAGGDTRPPNFGGGRADHDARYIEQAVSLPASTSRPGRQHAICLVVSLVNPHDLLAFPRHWQDDYTPRDLEGNVELPASFDEDLAGNYKPTAHALMRPAIDMAVGKESIRVPLIISNPELVPDGRTCPHPASLLDLLPTVAGLLGVEPLPGLRGTSLAPLVRDAGAPPVQDEILFTFDDMHAGSGLVQEILPGVPGRIRSIRERRFKYARYFHDTSGRADEHEMYDLAEDPHELHNLAHPDHPRFHEPSVAAERDRLAVKLAAIQERQTARIQS